MAVHRAGIGRGHTAAAPPGLLERVTALLAQAPPTWPDQPFGLELDESSADAVRAIYAHLTPQRPGAEQWEACVAEAMRIVHDHQQRS